MKRPYKMLAAAAAIVIAFTGVTSWLIPGDRSTGLAFGDILEQIREFRPYSCHFTYQYEGRKPFSYRIMRLSLARRREVRPDGTILVFDLSQAPNRILTLDPDKMLAVEKTLLGTEPRQDPDILRMLAGMREGTAEDLGTKEVDGKLAHGFRARNKINDITIWADPKTGLPIRVEVLQESLARTIAISDFEFDVAFDESLFSTTAPEGYTVEQVAEDGINPKEEHLLEGLRAMATLLGGEFPPMPPTLEKQALEEAVQEIIQQNDPGLSAEEMESLQLKTQRCGYIGLLQGFYRVKNLSYAGQGVKLGDAQTPIFWWQPQATESYRVIYGDLSARDVEASELPIEPQTQD